MEDFGIDNNNIDEERKDFENLVFLRNQLSVASMQVLKEVYSDMDNYICLLDTLVLLTQVDGGFLLMSNDYYDRILTLVDLHRFDAEDIVRKVANNIIVYINDLSSKQGSSLNTRLLIQYKEYQEDLREVNFDNIQDLINSVAYDAVVLLALSKDRLDIIDNEDYFMYSLNYIMKCFPEYFHDDEFKERAITALKMIHDKQSIFKRDKKKFSKEMINNIVKIKKKEE